MCVLSAVHDGFYDQWRRPTPEPAPFAPFAPATQPNNWFPKIPTQAEIDEFRELLEKARKQDEAEGNADCATEEKKSRVRDLLLSLAEEFDMKIDITFLD